MMTDPINISSIFSRAESSTLHSRLSTMLCIFSSSLFFIVRCRCFPLASGRGITSKQRLTWNTSIHLSYLGQGAFASLILSCARVVSKNDFESSLFFFVGKMFVKGRKKILHLLIPIQHRSTSCRKSLNNEKPVNQYQTAVAVVKLKVGRRILSTLREEFSHLLCGTLT